MPSAASSLTHRLSSRRKLDGAAAELQQDQALLRDQLEKLPGATRESAEAMRRALQDQLRALDQLTQLSRRAAFERDVVRPSPGQASQRINADSAPARERTAQPEVGGTSAAERTGRGERAISPEDRTRALSSLTSTLQREMTQRQTGGRSNDTRPNEARPADVRSGDVRHEPSARAQGAAPCRRSQQHQRILLTRARAAPPQQPPLPHQPASIAQPTRPAGAAERGDGWRLGELLQRASHDETGAAPMSGAGGPQSGRLARRRNRPHLLILPLQPEQWIWQPPPLCGRVIAQGSAISWSAAFTRNRPASSMIPRWRAIAVIPRSVRISGGSWASSSECWLIAMHVIQVVEPPLTR